jgi:hypothetical protein
MKTVFQWWESKNASWGESTALNPAMKNACSKITNALIIVKISSITVSWSLEKLNAWNIDIHAKINVEAALARNAKISASTNKICALLSLGKKIVMMLGLIVLKLAIKNAYLKISFAWIIAPKKTNFVWVIWVSKLAWTIGSLANSSAL